MPESEVAQANYLIHRRMNSIKTFIKGRISSVIASIIIFTVLISLLLSGTSENIFGETLSYLCTATREPVGIACMITLALLAYLAFSKFGKIKIGGYKAKKEFSNLSWISMLFAAGMGIGLLFYSSEGLFHMNSNPYFENAGGIEGYSLALFDWSIVPWSLYALMGVIVAYFHFNKGRQLKLSSILPKETNIWIKRGIDIIMTLGILAGLTTSLGLGIIQLESGLRYVFGFEVNPYLLMLIVELVALWSVMTGLQKGMKWLSNITIALAGILITVIYLIGKFSLNLDFNEFIGAGTGHFLGNFARYMNVFDSNSDAWAAAWPVFYQLWYASWAAFVGVFVAKISKGRSFREFIMGVVAIPSLMTIIWFGVFGRIELSMANELFPLMQNDITQSLFAFLGMITSDGAYQLISGVVMLLLCLFFITSSDSGSFVVASMLTEKGPINPKDKLYWCGIECLMAMVLYGCGGLALIQSASVIMGLPVLLLMLFGAGYFLRTIQIDRKQLTNK